VPEPCRRVGDRHALQVPERCAAVSEVVRGEHRPTVRKVVATPAPSIDLTAFLTSDERRKLAELDRAGMDADVLSQLVEATARPRPPTAAVR